MGYRGQDIDLRTPQTWSETPADLAQTENGPRGRGYDVPRGGPIWVDEALLACCNHAYDIALANRANEVRLEHLLHALTRLEEAIESLETRGVHVAAMRRDSAALIAAEVPVGFSNGKSSPRRSPEMEEALRLAAEQAYRRNEPASIDDLLDVFLLARPDLPGLALLERNIGPGAGETPLDLQNVRRSAYLRRSEPAEPPRRQRERPRRSVTRAFAEEPAMAPMPAERAATMTDQMQNSRIAALEQMVRTLAGEISGYRGEASRASLGMGERLQSIERLVSEGAGEGIARFIVERIAALERTIEARLEQLEQSGRGGVDLTSIERQFGQLQAKLDPTPLASRLELIEEAVLSRDTGVDAGLAERVGAIERALESVAASVRAVEEAERAHRTEIYEAHASLTSEIKAASSAIAAEAQRAGARHAEADNGFQGLARRIVAMEAQLAEGAKKASEMQVSYNEDLKELHEALMKLSTNQHTLAGSLDQWRLDASGDVSVISNRLASLEAEAGKPMRLLETLSAGMDSLSGNMETMHRLTVQRYYRRNRFWYWLFGTDDWVAASWPSQAERIESEQRAVRPLGRK
ncbi:MAG: hypothetical protein AB1749_01670 [Pseudomonadota bacterium]